MNPEPRIAFITDALPAIGGGEKVLFTALDVFPQADVFTLIYNRAVFSHTPLARRNIITSALDHWPLARKHHRLFLPVMPRMVEQFNLCGYDLIISFSYAVAHGILSPAGARHISYTYTPMRYAWNQARINKSISGETPIIAALMRKFRKWDLAAIQRVHELAAVSEMIAKRIQTIYQRTARVIYPPVDTARFQPATQREEFYITVSRLVSHKRIDLLVEAFSHLKLPLLIVGDGPELKKLQARAAANIRFLGYQSEETVAALLGKARGFVCAANEDFGIAMVEAQAAGCPVIAYGTGGALETIVHQRTGLHFHEQTSSSLIHAIAEFEKIHNEFAVPEITANAQRFDQEHFKKNFREFATVNWQPSK